MIHNLGSISCKRYPTPLNFGIKGDNINATNDFLIILKRSNRFHLMRIYIDHHLKPLK